MKIFRASRAPDSNSNPLLSPRSRTGARAPAGSENPLNNFLDDVNWTKGKHTITMGFNFRYNRNNMSTLPMHIRCMRTAPRS